MSASGKRVRRILTLLPLTTDFDYHVPLNKPRPQPSSTVKTMETRYIRPLNGNGKRQERKNEKPGTKRSLKKTWEGKTLLLSKSLQT